MFWRVAGFSQPSPLENILDKDDFTLEEVRSLPRIVRYSPHFALRRATAVKDGRVAAKPEQRRSHSFTA